MTQRYFGGWRGYGELVEAFPDATTLPDDGAVLFASRMSEESVVLFVGDETPEHPQALYIAVTADSAPWSFEPVTWQVLASASRDPAHGFLADHGEEAMDAFFGMVSVASAVTRTPRRHATGP